MDYGRGMEDEDGQTYEFHKAAAPEGPFLTMNQLVSYNLMRIRRSQGWKQQDVARQLEKHTGRSWSNASVSAAERAWQGGRMRRFDAGELMAFARVFGVPLVYFLLPPDGEDEVDWVTMSDDRDAPLSTVLNVKQLVRNVLIDEPPIAFTTRTERVAKEIFGARWDAPTWYYRWDFEGEERNIYRKIDDGSATGDDEYDTDQREAARAAMRTSAQDAEAKLDPGELNAILLVYSQNIAQEIVRTVKSEGFNFISPPIEGSKDSTKKDEAKD